MKVTRLFAVAAVASLLAACSGAGTQTVPATQQSVVSAPGSHTLTVGTATLHIMFTRDMVAAQPFPADPSQVVTESKHTTSNNLTYHGGPIQTAPKIYVVFWGSAWNSSSGDPDGMASYYVNFLKAAAGSRWLNTVTQYTQSDGQHVGNSGITISTWTDTGNNPPSSPTQSDLAAEAVRAAAQQFHDYSANASYVIVSPHGIKPSGFGSYCAWHSSTSTSNGVIAYTNLPYIPDAGAACGVGAVNNPGTLDGVSIVGGHEQAETETDPQPNTGWLDSRGSEIGDKCAWINLIDNKDAGGYPTQPLWSNASSSCVQSY